MKILAAPLIGAGTIVMATVNEPSHASQLSVLVSPSMPLRAQEIRQTSITRSVTLEFGRSMMISDLQNRVEREPAKAMPQESNSPNSMLISIGAPVAAAIIAIGLVIGYLAPGPLTGLILPVGLTLWYGLYRVVLRNDERTSHS